VRYRPRRPPSLLCYAVLVLSAGVPTSCRNATLPGVSIQRGDDCCQCEARDAPHAGLVRRAHRRHARRAQWFTKAGFQDVRIKRIGPKWYRGVRRHGLIMGCSVTGVKTQARPARGPRGARMPCIRRTGARREAGRAARGGAPALKSHEWRSWRAAWPHRARRQAGGQACRRNAGLAPCLLSKHGPETSADVGRAARAARQAGDSPLQMGPKLEASGKSSGNPFAFLGRFVLGTLAGGYYFVLPIYMWLKNLVWPRGLPGF